MSLADESADAPLCLPPLPLVHPPKALLPDGSCDTHFHVFRAGAPLSTPRSYTPQMQTIEDWQAYARAVNIARGVLVQPSVYGFDNSVLLEALAADPARLRGVVVLPPETSREEFKRLDRLGVRGVRVNTRNKGGLPLSAVSELAARIADLGWVLQFQVNAAHLDDIARLARDLPCPSIIDHVGFVPLGEASEPYAKSLLELLELERCYLKVSAPYRLDKGPDFIDFAALVRRLAASRPERLLWGSDWPHTELWEQMPDDAHLIDLVQDWFKADDRQRIFVANPETLFFTR